MTPRIHIATPAFGGQMYAQYVRSLLDLTHALRDRGIDHVVDFVIHESLIQRARNHCVSDFLEDPASTHLLFIDADIRFRPTDVLAMLATGKDVVCGAYPSKNFVMPELAKAFKEGHPDPMKAGTRLVINVLQPEFGEKSRDFVSDKGCVPILEAATGFLLISRAAILKLIAAHPESLYESDAPASRGRPMWALFDCGIINHGPRDIARRYLSEDYWFSKLWRDLGEEIWLYLPAELGHVGQHMYRGDVYKIFKPNVEPLSEWSDIPSLDDRDPSKHWHLWRYAWAADRIIGRKIANAACCTNYGAVILKAGHPEREITGYDRNDKALGMSEFYGHPVKKVGDLCDERLEGHDCVVCLETLEHLERPWDWVRNLAPREAVFSVPVVPTMHQNPYHLSDFTPDELRAGLARNGWGIIEEAFQDEWGPKAVMIVHAVREAA